MKRYRGYMAKTFGASGNVKSGVRSLATLNSLRQVTSSENMSLALGTVIILFIFCKISFLV
jgi:hypothetical protein